MTFYNRATWTSEPRGGHVIKNVAQFKAFTPHWPAVNDNLLGLTKAQVISRLRGWLDLHTSAPRNWADIGYHFAIDGSGNIWELRGPNRTGAHAAGHNSTRYGVLFIIGMNETPNAKMISAWYDLLSRYPHAAAGKIVDHGRLSGQSTQCAGSHVRRLIDNGTISNKPSAPVPTPEPEKPNTVKIVSNALTPVLPKLKGVTEDEILDAVKKTLSDYNTPKPDPNTLPFWIGHWNVTSPTYSDSPAPWNTRGPRVAAALRDNARMGGCSFYVLNEVMTSAMTATFKAAFGSRWRHGGSALGTDAYDDSHKFSRAFWREYSGTFNGQRRGFSLGEFKREWLTFNVVGVHGPTGTDDAGIKGKKAYASWLVGRIRNFSDPTIVIGDFNHASHYDGSLAAELKKIGYVVTDDDNSIDKIAVKGLKVSQFKTVNTGSTLSTHPGYQYRIVATR